MNKALGGQGLMLFYFIFVPSKELGPQRNKISVCQLELNEQTKPMKLPNLVAKTVGCLGLIPGHVVL